MLKPFNITRELAKDLKKCLGGLESEPLPPEIDRLLSRLKEIPDEPLRKSLWAS